ncbi:hypothetical protein G1C97_1855 [Bifidobacterium sp. DSM 109959]|uniref:Uncharacterized protein n=1 Tax=Bifidobacterium olomucense TaxID=2675324 RepID=A0A7Y0HY29_9BIFI|nr:hypothetical protein [Bifidobacterium sp. DSM 109959]
MGVIVPAQPLVTQIDVPTDGNQPLVRQKYADAWIKRVKRKRAANAGHRRLQIDINSASRWRASTFMTSRGTPLILHTENNTCTRLLA